MFPPVGKETRPRGYGTLGDDEPLALLGVGEVVAADAGADASERFAFELVSLTPVLAEDDGAFALDDAGEEAAGADGGELLRIADQDRLPRACSTSSSTGASTRVSAIAASSTTSTDACGRPPWPRACSSSR